MKIPLCIVLLAISSPVVAQSRIAPLQQAFKSCLTRNIVEFGQSNREGADMIVRAARSKCTIEEQALVDIYGALMLSPRHTTSLIERDRRAAEDAGIAAVLELRANPIKN
jgi:hypothetical protein